jgi:hypothetical protein
MIPYQQLNYVKFNGMDCQVIGTSFSDHTDKKTNLIQVRKIGSDESPKWQSENELQPIKITSDWLRRLGFWQSDMYWTKDRFDLVFTPDMAILLGINPRYQIEYVHELQNWHLALTGEPLSCNLYENS